MNMKTSEKKKVKRKSWNKTKADPENTCKMIRRWSPFLFLLQLITQLEDRQTEKERHSGTFPGESPTSEASLKEPPRHLSIVTFPISSCSLLLSACLDVCPQEIHQKKQSKSSFWVVILPLFCTCSFRDTQMCRNYAGKWSFSSM